MITEKEVYCEIIRANNNNTIDVRLLSIEDVKILNLGENNIINIRCNNWTFNPLSTLFNANMSNKHYFKLYIRDEVICNYALIEKNIYDNLKKRGFLK